MGATTMVFIIDESPNIAGLSNKKNPRSSTKTVPFSEKNAPGDEAPSAVSITVPKRIAVTTSVVPAAALVIAAIVRTGKDPFKAQTKNAPSVRGGGPSAR